MIDPDRIELHVPLGDVPELVPKNRRGKRVTYETVRQWSTKGCFGVVLATIRIGNQKFTTRESLRNFIRDVTRARTVARESPLPGSVDIEAGKAAVNDLKERFGVA